LSKTRTHFERHDLAKRFGSGPTKRESTAYSEEELAGVIEDCMEAALKKWI